MDKQSKTENELFFEKLEELQAAVPNGISLFFCAKEREGDETLGIVGCNTTGGDLVKMIKQAVIKAPQLRKGIEAGLILAKVENNPFAAIKDFFESKGSSFDGLSDLLKNTH